MSSEGISNLKASNSIDQNASFLATLSHAIANSAGTQGFIPYGKYSEKNTQNDIFFTESFESNDMQVKQATQKPPNIIQRANNKKITESVLYESLKDSM